MIDNRLVVYGLEGKQNGCNWYRIRQPMYKVMELDLFPAALSSSLPTLEEQTVWMDSADIVFSQLAKSEKYLDYMASWNGKKKFVLDYDDNIFCVSPYNPAYEFHGTAEVNVTLEGQTEPMQLWKDGENGFNIEENKKRIFLFTETLKAADVVTTTSTILANIFKANGAKNVRVIKNFLDFRTWNPVKIERDNYVTIGYQGGWSHYEDWLEIKDVLNEVMAKYPKTRLVVMGQHYEGALPNIDKSRIQVEPWAPVEIYPWKFKTLGIDIGICPLANTEFNRCKSEIKWEEYSALEIPTVATDIPPYSFAIRNEHNGFLASNKEEWVKYLGDLIESEELRRTIGQNARKHVLEYYDINNGVQDYKQAFDSAFNREIILSGHI